ncbi:hypothetical protein KC19_7G141600 [Ceratodon purpureus]|uniref:HTH myb-type domain-containing protein n=1 Tax=Ceratodon purpureus TaxID=3225 RepID=A0A8T0H6F2_CERPU|nr:hypothetical protein KC19_7G141600 [Ceratodon purpureus]
MGSPVDLTLGCSNGYHNEHRNGTYPGDYLESLRKAEEYLRTLEEERRKVEGFKRELPLCIQLLEDAIKASKEKLVNGKSHSLPSALRLSVSPSESGRDEESPARRPTLEEFMPLKRRWEREQGSEEETEDRGAKRPAWMEPNRELWNQSRSRSADGVRDEKEMKDLEGCEQEQSSVTSSQLRLSTASQRPMGAFLPFMREQPSSAGPVLSRPTPRSGGGAGLSLSLGERVTTPSGERLRGADSEVGSIDAGLQTPGAQIANDMGLMSNGTPAAAGSSSGGNSSRKARRCWSPELHRRFVSALHQLGGSQIATPKQIRELMKVDGLTNDEVKSHLQKYRLHTRRPSSSPQSAGAGQSPQLVVLGGIWMPPQYTASGSQPSSGVYDPSVGHPSQPTQFCQPQEYFACISNGTTGAPMQIHRQPIFESQPTQAGTSNSQTSPQVWPHI